MRWPSRAYGFAAIALSGHVAPTSEVTDVYPPPFYDPLTAIAWLAGQSEDLAGLGADLIILDPNPDTPRPRDYTCEKNDLLAVRAVLTTRG